MVVDRKPKVPPPVPQLEEWGCGVACVAYVVGTTYQDARTRLFRGVRGDASSGLGYTRSALVEALARGGSTYRACRFPTGRRGEGRAGLVPVGGILFVHAPPFGRWGHYVVRCPVGWMDPLDADWKRDAPWVPSSTGRIRRSLPPDWYAMSFLAAAID